MTAAKLRKPRLCDDERIRRTCNKVAYQEVQPCVEFSIALCSK